MKPSYNTRCNYTEDQPNYNPVKIAELCKKFFQGRYLFPDAGRRYRSALAQADSLFSACRVMWYVKKSYFRPIFLRHVCTHRNSRSRYNPMQYCVHSTYILNVYFCRSYYARKVQTLCNVRFRAQKRKTLGLGSASSQF